MTDWLPSSDLATLRARQLILDQIQVFFRDRSMLKVDTPLLSSAATTDVHITPINTQPLSDTRYLQTSPEYPMKRLLAAGSGPIWQMCKVFREGEAGSRHNPEFTMLEWYQPGWTMAQLMNEVETLVLSLLPDLGVARRLTYRQAFLNALGIDPLLCSLDEAQEAARAHDAHAPDLGADRDAWLDYLLTQCVEPLLPVFCFVYDYPASQAALARIRPATDSQPAVAQRFELYVNGMELANGYQELTDAVELRHRFESDNHRRAEADLPTMPIDENLLAAMEHGLPECAGVAMGVDRLVMQVLGKERIEEVLAFPWDRA